MMQVVRIVRAQMVEQPEFGNGKSPRFARTFAVIGMAGFMDRQQDLLQ